MDATIDHKQRLVDGNALFRKGIDPAFLARLAKKQEPFIAILSCADSRVSPIKIFNLSLGDAFVVSVAGNTVSDPSILGSFEYAVEHHHVRAILVLGHTNCGAIRAVLDGATYESMRGIIRDIERAQHKTAIENSNDPDAIAESNVRLQLRMLEDSSSIIGRAVSEGRLVLYGAIYDLATGQVRFI